MILVEKDFNLVSTFSSFFSYPYMCHCLIFFLSFLFYLSIPFYCYLLFLSSATFFSTIEAVISITETNNSFFDLSIPSRLPSSSSSPLLIHKVLLKIVNFICFINPSDKSGLTIISSFCNNFNYHSCSRYMLAAMCLKNNLGFLDGGLIHLKDSN